MAIGEGIAIAKLINYLPVDEMHARPAAGSLIHDACGKPLRRSDVSAVSLWGRPKTAA